MEAKDFQDDFTQKYTYMHGIALEKGRGSNQYITQLRIFRVCFKYSSENATEDGVCDPRLA